jgi:hypothetical protein
MTEYLTQTKNLNPLQPNHSYYQWPAFFLISYLATLVSGLSLQNFEFLFYTMIGFLLTISLHFYASRAYRNSGFLMVIAFFISMFYFLNYQGVPFSLALGFLFLLFMLETEKKSLKITVMMEILFIGLVLTHAFAPMFFIIYLLFRTILDKSKYYGQLFLFAISLFFIIQLTIAQDAFATHIMVVLNSSSEYSSVFQATAAPAVIPFDDLAQLFSRIVTVAFIGISSIGFVYLLLKRKLRNLDKALLLTGIVYTGIGFFLAALGTRALILTFIPISLGTVWLFESKINQHIKNLFSLIIILSLILFLFIPVHLSFNNAVHYQTKEAYKAENFFLDHINWEDDPYVLVYSSIIPYIDAKVDVYTNLVYYVEEGAQYDAVLYTLGLGKDLLPQNYTSETILQEQNMNLLYHNGFSKLATRPGI